MNRNETQDILYYTCEIQNIIYEVQECEQVSCKSCNYNGICEVVTSLIKLLEYKANEYNKKGE